jgi:hypothetical protein
MGMSDLAALQMRLYIKLIHPKIRMPDNFQRRFPEQTSVNGQTGTGPALWVHFMQFVKRMHKLIYYKEQMKVQVPQIHMQYHMYF